VAFRKYKASEKLGVFRVLLGVYPGLRFAMLLGEHTWRHLYA